MSSSIGYSLASSSVLNNQKLAFGALRALRENVENQADAIDDAALQCAFEIALLCARQRMVEDNEIGVGCDAPRGDFVDLAAAGEEGRVGPGASRRDDVCDFGTGRSGEVLELRQPRLGLARTKIDFDQQRVMTLPFLRGLTGPRVLGFSTGDQSEGVMAE